MIGRLKELIGGTWIPLLVSTVLFGAWHLYQSPRGWIGATIMGIVFGYVYIRTQRLWPLIAAHFIYNTYITWIAYHALGTL